MPHATFLPSVKISESAEKRPGSFSLLRIFEKVLLLHNCDPICEKGSQLPKIPRFQDFELCAKNDHGKRLQNCWDTSSITPFPRARDRPRFLIPLMVLYSQIALNSEMCTLFGNSWGNDARTQVQEVYTNMRYILSVINLDHSLFKIVASAIFPLPCLRSL